MKLAVQGQRLLDEISWPLRLRYRIEYGIFRAVAGLIGALSFDRASRICGLSWRLIAPHLHRHERALQNLALAFPEKSAAERERIALAMWDNLGRTFAEFFHIPAIVAAHRLVNETPDVYAEMPAQSATIVCGLHMGNWELSGAPLVEYGLNPASIYQNVSNPWVDRYVLRLRQTRFPGGIFPKGVQSVNSLLKTIGKGGCIGIVADLRDGGGILAPFFGRPAQSSPFPAMAARLRGASLYACRVKRIAGVNFTIQAEKIAVPESADKREDIRVATLALHAAFERMIRDAPEQWMWAHRRWD